MYSKFCLTALSIKSYKSLHSEFLLSRSYYIAVQVYKAINWLSPHFLSGVFDLISSRTNCLFQYKYRVVTPYIQTNKGKSIFYSNDKNSLHKDLYDCLSFFFAIGFVCLRPHSLTLILNHKPYSASRHKLPKIQNFISLF